MEYFLIGFAIILIFVFTAYRLRTMRLKTQHLRYLEDDNNTYLENISEEYSETLYTKVRAAQLKELANNK